MIAVNLVLMSCFGTGYCDSLQLTEAVVQDDVVLQPLRRDNACARVMQTSSCAGVWAHLLQLGQLVSGAQQAIVNADAGHEAVEQHLILRPALCGHAVSASIDKGGGAVELVIPHAAEASVSAHAPLLKTRAC